MFVIFLYAVIIVLSNAQSVVVKFYNKKSENALSFNCVRSFSAFAVFIVMGCVSGFSLHVPSLLYGSLFGALVAVSMYSGHRALCIGPLSLTSPIVAFNLVIPSAYGILFLQEPVTIFKICGFFALAASIVFFGLSKEKKEGEEQRKASWAWLLFVIAAFVCNGSYSIVQKIHQMRYPNAYLNEMMTAAMCTASVLFFLLAATKKQLPALIKEPGKGYAVFSGVANAATNFLTLYLARLENASVLYPVISAGTLLASMIVGALLFKEKQTPLRITALVFGISAIVLLKL